ncbi:DUF6266 family protein [Pedobacter sp. JY14-1]|uniref:DUF6266 family protein n=1 Tax=Pedobacter sp. JY14-1 TaxID=3034151 RepID=UPI0023E1AACB|nr:DUF6266 family protein [Pedobacter sp. JY14-1]
MGWMCGWCWSRLATSDKVTIVVYNTAKDEFCSMVAAAQRSALGYDMPVPVNWSGDQVYTWLFFVSEKGKMNSSSEVFGPLEIQ